MQVATDSCNLMSYHLYIIVIPGLSAGRQA